VGLARGVRPFRDVKSGQWVTRPYYDGLIFHRVIKDFIVQSGGQGPKVTDVKVEGVSLLVTKRSEFDSVIAQKGIDGLIQALRRKVDETLG